MISLDEVKKRVEEAITGADVTVTDLTGQGDHLEIRVVADAFAGKNLIARHRMVYAALGSAVGGDIHAAKLVTKTAAEAGRD